MGGKSWVKWISMWCSEGPQGLRPLVAEKDTYHVIMCLWGGLGSAGSGSGPASGCGWSAGRTPGLWGPQVLRSRQSCGDCRGPQHTDWCRSQLHVLDCWCCSRCWMTQSPRRPGPAQETEGGLCSAFWLGAPGGRSPHHRHCAAVSCCQSTYDDTKSVLTSFFCCLFGQCWRTRLVGVIHLLTER